MLSSLPPLVDVPVPSGGGQPGYPSGYVSGAATEAWALGEREPLDAGTAESFLMDLSAFMQRNAHAYIYKFRKFNVGGIDRYAFTWHWPAFFTGPWWFLYRKLYLWASVSFVAGLSIMAWMVFGVTLNWTHYKLAFVVGSVCSLLAWTYFGAMANWVYYLNVKSKITAVREAKTPRALATLTALGGVHRWMVPVGIVLSAMALVIIIVAAFLASLGALHLDGGLSVTPPNIGSGLPLGD